MKADLHMHTSYSFDGEKTTKEIIELAKEKGMDAIAITDHNMIEGSLESLSQKDLIIISGIEIDCYFDNKIYHLLGYGCDLTHPRFKEISVLYHQELQRIFNERLSKINNLFSLSITQEQIREKYARKILTNIEIVQYMMNYMEVKQLEPYKFGNRKDNALANFYWDYCAVGKPIYVEMNLPKAQDVIDLFHESNGLAFIAHPMVMVENLLETTALKNVDGIEAYCSYHSLDQAKNVIEFAQSQNWLISAGSDYHGIVKPNIEIGDTKEVGPSDHWFDKILDALH